MAATPAMADAPGLAAYLRARAAEGDGRVSAAAVDYAHALAEAPASGDVALRTYRAALAAGDIAIAQRAAVMLQREGAAPADVTLLSLATAAARNDAAGVEAAARPLAGSPLAVLTPALADWVAHARGLSLPPGPGVIDDAITRRLAAESRALLAIGEGHPTEGADAVAALAGSDTAADLRLGAARLLYGAGQPQRAAALIPGADPTFAALRARPLPAMPTLSFGVSWLLTRVAADLIAADPGPLSIAFARAATVAAADNGRARLLLAAALARSGDRRAALAALDSVRADSPAVDAATSLRIGILADGGEQAAALALAKAQAERPGADAGDWSDYADRLLAADRPGEAAPWYGRIVAGDGAANWLAWMQYGGALDQAGDWTQARPALEKAVALGPNQALALNYLGYSLIEHGADRKRALALLERAATIAPNDPSIADSLGWARFRTGDAAGALPLIERAAQASPANATIGLHLGDIYWSTGRRYEARYAWRAAALTATGAEAAEIAARLADGPPQT